MKFVRFLVLAALLAPVVDVSAAASDLAAQRSALEAAAAQAKDQKVLKDFDINVLVQDRSFNGVIKLFRPYVKAPADSATIQEKEAFNQIVEAAQQLYSELDSDSKLSNFLNEYPSVASCLFAEVEEIYTQELSKGSSLRSGFPVDKAKFLAKKRDAFIATMFNTFNSLSGDSKKRLDVFFKKMRDAGNKEEGFVKKVAKTLDILVASEADLEKWIQWGKDISDMHQDLCKKLEEKGLSLDDSLNRSFDKALKSSGSPQDRFFKSVKALSKFAKRRKVIVDAPKWYKDNEEKVDESKTLSSSNASFLHKHPLLRGFGIGALFLGASVAKSILDYKNNPPRDENGNVISMKMYVLQQLANFDPQAVQCWLKVGAVAAVAAGVYVKVTTPAAA